ncbi:hypothetical protein [Nonomuraea recticatena]|uniref:Uncharacterized protein n=1 Tax=Nonomuraea recticatena TaxID=46178 RepID=A0ABP6EP01_9ACTN
MRVSWTIPPATRPRRFRAGLRARPRHDHGGAVHAGVGAVIDTGLYERAHPADRLAACGSALHAGPVPREQLLGLLPTLLPPASWRSPRRPYRGRRDGPGDPAQPATAL